MNPAFLTPPFVLDEVTPTEPLLRAASGAAERSPSCARGVKGAMSEISQIKVIAPAVAQKAADAVIQIHGGAGVSADFPLAALYAHARVPRLAGGPDEMHRGVIAKLELKMQLAAVAPAPP